MREGGGRACINNTGADDADLEAETDDEPWSTRLQKLEEATEAVSEARAAGREEDKGRAVAAVGADTDELPCVVAARRLVE